MRLDIQMFTTFIPYFISNVFKIIYSNLKKKKNKRQNYW